MTNDDEELRDDEKLGAEFAGLRAVDARRTPSFAALRKPRVVRPLRPALFAVIPLVASAAALLFVCNGPEASEPPQTSAPSAVDVPLGGGFAVARPATSPLPLDFLLQTRVASTDLGSVRAGSFDSDFLLRAPTDLRGPTP